MAKAKSAIAFRLAARPARNVCRWSAADSSCLPPNGAWRIGGDDLEGFLLPVRRFQQRVAVDDVEIRVVDVVQGRVDTGRL